jgi:hypothetical protein
MASRRVLEVNRRRHKARQAVIESLKPLGDGILPTWRAVLALERAAFQCGVERERARALAPYRAGLLRAAPGLCRRRARDVRGK